MKSSKNDAYLPYGCQSIDDSDINAVADVLRSEFLTQGPVVERFERAICDITDAKYGISCNSATSGLHAACLALGVGPGDIVWTSPNSFIASANCALYCGAEIDFVDIDPASYNLCPNELADKLHQANRTNKLPKVIILVHYAGTPCDLQKIAKLAQQYNVKIIEDAAHALGASYQSKPIGNCQYSDICVFSFHPVKIITTGEGGMVTTQNEQLAKKIKLLCNQGIERSSFQYPSPGDWYYEQQSLGFNYRMTDIQAALGVSQLKKLNNFIETRHKLAVSYDSRLTHLPLTTPDKIVSRTSARHLYPIVLNSDLALMKERIFRRLREENIGVQCHYIPIHTQPFYQKLGFKLGDYPIAEDFYRREISLPIHPRMTTGDVDMVSACLEKILSE